MSSEVRSAPNVTPAVQAVYSDLLKLAAELAVQGSGISDEHPKPASRRYWFGLIERADDRARERAIKLRQIADRLVKP